MPHRFVCSSKVEQVMVYARGALVSRRVTPPSELPREALDLVVTGVTPAAAPGCMRATVASGRQVLGAQARLLVPEDRDSGGQLRARVLELERTSDQLSCRIDERRRRRAELDNVDPRPALNGRSRRADPHARFSDALAVQSLVDELVTDLDRELSQLESEREQHALVLTSARGELEQATTAQKAMPGHPVWEVTIHLSAGDAPQGLQLVYPVPAARWWPAYSARVSTATESAEMALEAFVAQAAFEDWSGVQLGVCTADMAADASLPELPSLRIGRAQPSRSTGYRPPPEGLDTLFSGFDEVMRASPGVVASAARPAPPAPRLPPAPASAPLPAFAPPPPPQSAPAPMSPPAGSGAVPEQAVLRARGAFAAMARRMRSAPPAGDLPDEAPELLASAPAPAEPAQPTAVTPGDAWLDFDSLVLAGAAAPGQRGRLIRRDGAASAPSIARAEAVIAAARPLGGGTHDPLTARGHFDHRFDANGLVDVPSTGVPHRILLCSAQATIRRRFRTAPREVAEVFREATLTNPFPAPLLGGPLDLFMDGALVSTAVIEPVGRGGTLVLGLGTEERLRVARNVRADEKARGMLGGTIAVEHEIEIELASALGTPVEIEVLERMPVTDEKDARVVLVESRPEAQKYDQAELGAPVRGGLCWKVALPPGQKTRLTWSYRVELPGKCEIIGGNRRD